MESNDSLCYFCKSSTFKYVCPRCNVGYCSVDCYKSPAHSDCSESFYKENIQEWLAAEGPDSQSKKKMMEILQRVNRQDNNEPISEEEDSDDEKSLTDRMAVVDLNNADEVWESLLPEEQQEFIDLIKTGDVTQLIPTWEPWWEIVVPVPKVRFLDEETQPAPYIKTSPNLYDKVPQFSTVCKTEPSSLVYFNMVNVLASYAVTARYTNGDLDSLPLETATTLIVLSRNLSANEVYPDTDTAIVSVCTAVTNCSWVTLELDVKLRDLLESDVKSILKGPNQEDSLFFTKAALSDSIRLLIKAKKSYKSKPNRNGKFSSIFSDSSESVQFVETQTLTKCIKKLEYYLSWLEVHLLTFQRTLG